MEAKCIFLSTRYYHKILNIENSLTFKHSSIDHVSFIYWRLIAPCIWKGMDINIYNWTWKKSTWPNFLNSPKYLGTGCKLDQAIAILSLTGTYLFPRSDDEPVNKSHRVNTLLISVSEDMFSFRHMIYLRCALLNNTNPERMFSTSIPGHKLQMKGFCMKLSY